MTAAWFNKATLCNANAYFTSNKLHKILQTVAYLPDTLHDVPGHYFEGRPTLLTSAFLKLLQVGTTFISQNVLRTTLLLSPLKAYLSFFLNDKFVQSERRLLYVISKLCLRFSTKVCDTQFTLILFFCLFWTNVQSKRTTRAEPEDHLWSADHSLRNTDLDDKLLLWTSKHSPATVSSYHLTVCLIVSAKDVKLKINVSRAIYFPVAARDNARSKL
jgi:hypothetical protein